MPNISMKLLAKELQLSVSTVSKVFTDSHEISEQTKQKVLALAKKLNYVPNPYASSLRKRKSKTIAVVLPEVADSFFSMAINGIESIAREKGYHVLIYLTHEQMEREQAILSDFQSGRVDGVLISISNETTNDEHIIDMMQRGIPVVFFDRVCEETATTRITTNDRESGQLAAQHLIDQGCRNIAYLTISGSLSISRNRLAGVKQALTAHRTPFNERNLVMCTDNEEENLRIIKELLQRKDRPDGIIASVEKLTAAVYLACKELKIAIPGKLKVISFSNQTTAPILNPSLTTITQPAFAMGKLAAEVLFNSLKKTNVTLKAETVVVPSALVVRESTTGRDLG
ncbi:LacI family DNA-binding transcriptional regulator [Paraflavitalea sp. CAU 1676]|uniref:LacI family DNA-binding transcriptional regulator n=1 Tax=Paraflavitalea sp. CAU 1676 TaxID=3032598 RepID=UPI0023DCB846|nr:LacI family DNA-binding transcriptional regulator [Paraflavitalea sp. CAU 1676]MDF2188245.1 LacI family DNA-binding transcriptional regulator [Paraflavitalea sp. CAU 1676]